MAENNINGAIVEQEGNRIRAILAYGVGFYGRIDISRSFGFALTVEKGLKKTNFAAPDAVVVYETTS